MKPNERAQAIQIALNAIGELGLLAKEAPRFVSQIIRPLEAVQQAELKDARELEKKQDRQKKRLAKQLEKENLKKQKAAKKNG